MSTAGVVMAEKRALVSVKIDAEVYRLVKTVASWKDMNVADYLSEIARPIAERDFARISKEIEKSKE